MLRMSSTHLLTQWQLTWKALKNIYIYQVLCTSLCWHWMSWWKSPHCNQCIASRAAEFSVFCASGWSRWWHQQWCCTDPESSGSCPTKCSALATTWHGLTNPWQCLQVKSRKKMVKIQTFLCKWNIWDMYLYFICLYTENYSPQMVNLTKDILPTPLIASQLLHILFLSDISCIIFIWLKEVCTMNFLGQMKWKQGYFSQAKCKEFFHCTQ